MPSKDVEHVTIMSLCMFYPKCFFPDDNQCCPLCKTI